jgi:predicted RNA-binding Zn ribbon-like protein
MVVSEPQALPPHGLGLTIEFVNTLDPDDGSDALGSAAALASWLVAHGLLSRGSRVGERDRSDAVELREALRALMLEHSGEAPAAGAAAVLDRVARRGKLAARFGAEELGALRAGSPGAAGALARLLVPVFESARDGSWQRAKACRAPDCRWAFYDRSRNRSGVWCEMAVCGNRAKVRSYRARRSPQR